MNSGFNANRRLAGSGGANIIGHELEKINTKGQSGTLFKAVVVEVITDPFSLTEEQLETIGQSVNNPELADVMPVNAVIAQIIANGGGMSSGGYTILFPLYQSHIMFPVNPGEIVYAIYEDYSDTGNKIGYWLTRTSGQKTTEDVNYTHLDRRFDKTTNQLNYSTFEKTQLSEITKGPDFQNGGGTEDTTTIPVLKKGENPFDTILKQSLAFKLITPEPVPRWKKRPGDFVLQGSNNTLICFGEDRSGPLENTQDAKGFAGTIDIVVGRGRDIPKGDDEEPKLNAPRVITNSRGKLETDKAPFRRGTNKSDNPNEGNPDFDHDAARLYVSMQTDGDTKFKINLNPTKSLSLPKLPTIGTFNKGYVVAKSDHIRLIARQNDEKGVKGTVLLIKEGNPDQNLGYFFINENGQIQIEGPKIYKGKATGETEPEVLYTNYQETITSLQKQIDTLCDVIGAAMQGSIGNLGAPIPTLLATTPTVLKAATADSRTKVTNNTKPDQHSLKIFNEPNPNR